VRGIYTKVRRIYTKVRGIHTKVRGIYTKMRGIYTKVRMIPLVKYKLGVPPYNGCVAIRTKCIVFHIQFIQ
jgi:hypothetical protein